MRLIEKYNHPVPRYTSYPTVPYWMPKAPDQQQWLNSLITSLQREPSLSLYVHLPFCESLCTYCGCNKHITRNHRVEGPYIETVLRELDLYLSELGSIRPQLSALHFGGGTPTFFSPTALQRLTEGIVNRFTVAEVRDFAFEAHPNGTTAEHLAVLAGAGFNRISVGVQDFNPDILAKINRKQTEAQVYATVNNARKYGYSSINFDLIYGLPGQQHRDIDYTADRVAELRPDRIAFYGYAHVPWKSPGQRAYSEDDLPRGADKWNLYTHGRDRFEEEGYIDIGLDHFSLPTDELAIAHRNGKLHRNFMGYTTVDSPVTIGLGCSAIGDSWGMYVQNEKTVKEYQRIVNEENRLPLIKGYSLTANDQKVRQHILNIMCQGATEWEQSKNSCSAISRAMLHWDEMAADGLVKLTDNRVEVTESGEPFLRNLCLPLDDHYWARRPQTQAFSKAV
ncbi:MAG: oxygen-independent coproporphyrinogen III oxidase [Bacteroidota bacterium]